MSEILTKDDVIICKNESIKALDDMLETFIDDPSGRHLKKANLISYWIKDYTRFISFEEKFDPQKNIAYKRGNIVKLPFGFNIGSEYGGLHYGIVLDMKNAHKSPVITVIPLTSIKEGKIVHPNSVSLGNELYRLLKLKHDTISKNLQDEKIEIEKMLNIVEEQAKSIKTSEDLKIFNIFLDELKKKMTHNKEETESLKKIKEEISNMKEGSIALVNQITTVSKMRIYDPRNLHGILYGISLSQESMEKINQKVKELYIFS